MIREKAATNMIKEVSNIYNTGLISPAAIGRKLSLDRHTVAKYILEAKELGWIITKHFERMISNG